MPLITWTPAGSPPLRRLAGGPGTGSAAVGRRQPADTAGLPSSNAADGSERISRIHFYNESQFVNLDMSSRRNLELTETMRTHEKRGSLLWVLDKTKTAMGKRLHAATVEQPFVNPVVINKRLEAVDALYQDNILRSSITEALSSIFRPGTAHDPHCLRKRQPEGVQIPAVHLAEKIPPLKARLIGCKPEYLRNIYGADGRPGRHCRPDSRHGQKTMRPSPPRRGGVIEDGADESWTSCGILSSTPGTI